MEHQNDYSHHSRASLARFKSSMEEETIDRDIDMACPLDCNAIEKEKEKIRDYSQLSCDLRRQSPTHRVIFHPLVIGATGRLNSIRKEINSVLDEIKVTDSIVREMQKTVVVYTQQMIHRILTGLL